MNPDQLPTFLTQIWKQSQNNKEHKTFSSLKSRWNSFVEVIQSEIPTIHYDPNKELLYLGEISPGCSLCRSGQWDCFFVTSKCNLNCDFCISPISTGNLFSGSNLGPSPLNNAQLYSQLGIQGISISGGEPLLDKAKLFQWLEECNTSPLFSHCWLYTNGLLADESVLKELAARGLDEIRFNSAATAYNNQNILTNISLAATIIPIATIEIPLIPEDELQILTMLPDWVRCGVKHLNFHELIYEPGSRSAQMPGKRIPITFPDGHSFEINPDSAQSAKRIFHEIAKQKDPISLNFCSTIGKWRQLTTRREQLLKSHREPFETYIGDGILECIYQLSKEGYSPIKETQLETLINSFPSNNFYRVQRMINLTPSQQKKHWIAFEIIHEGW